MMVAPYNIFKVYKLCKEKPNCIAFLKRTKILPIEKQCMAGHDTTSLCFGEMNNYEDGYAETEMTCKIFAFFLYSWRFELATLKFCE